MAKLPEIASLWIGGRLSWLEQLCLKSFADMGHHTTLYSYAPIDNVPKGVHTADAADIFPEEPMLRHARTGSPAIHADMWRLQLLKKTAKIWVDADVYCYRPFDTRSKYVFGWEKPGLVCNAVLGLPKSSKTLAKLISFFKDEYAIAPWLSPEQQRELQAEKDAGKPVHMTAQNWGFTGPSSVTHFLQETGEIKHAHSVATFYPVSFKIRNHLIMSRFNPIEEITDETLAVHFWARRMKPRLEENENNTPRRGSFMDDLLKKHEIDPAAAPIPAKIVKRHDDADSPEFQTKIGQEAAAGDLSIDQVSRKYLVEPNFVKTCRDDFIAANNDGEKPKTAITKPQAAPVVDTAKLKYSMFDERDLLNFVLQRSGVLSDIPRRGRLIKEWSEGASETLETMVADKGVILAQRAAEQIGEEFDELRPVLDNIAPKSIADIGCGYATFCLFMSRAYDLDITLIDLEENGHRHFGFNEEGSACSNLVKAKSFLTKNGVKSGAIKTLNPEKNDILAVKPVDLAVSFFACGFHFPIDSYLPFFDKMVNPGGHIILDLRRPYFPVQSEKLKQLGTLTVIDEQKKYFRVLVHKDK